MACLTVYPQRRARDRFCRASAGQDREKSKRGLQRKTNTPGKSPRRRRKEKKREERGEKFASEEESVSSSSSCRATRNEGVCRCGTHHILLLRVHADVGGDVRIEQRRGRSERNRSRRLDAGTDNTNRKKKDEEDEEELRRRTARCRWRRWHLYRPRQHQHQKWTHGASR